jgi:hypothetical protein
MFSISLVCVPEPRNGHHSPTALAALGSALSGLTCYILAARLWMPLYAAALPLSVISIALGIVALREDGRSRCIAVIAIVLIATPLAIVLVIFLAVVIVSGIITFANR